MTISPFKLKITTMDNLTQSIEDTNKPIIDELKFNINSNQVFTISTWDHDADMVFEIDDDSRDMSNYVYLTIEQVTQLQDFLMKQLAKVGVTPLKDRLVKVLEKIATEPITPDEAYSKEDVESATELELLEMFEKDLDNICRNIPKGRDISSTSKGSDDLGSADTQSDG